MRHLPAAFALSLGFAGLIPGGAQANLVYVLNSGEASISLVDTTTREEVRRIPVLREVHHLILTPDGTELVVGDSGGNELIFIDPASGEVKRRERFSNPYHMEYSPDGKYLVVTSLRRDQVDIYEAATRTLLTRLRVPDKPSHLAYSPDSKLAYITLQGAKGLMAIDLAAGRPLWTAEVGSQPAGVIWNRGKLLVGIMGSDHIAVVSPADGKVERTIFLGRGTHTIFPSPDGKTLYATSRVDSRISVLDAETLDVTARWDIPGGPDCIAFDPEGKLWVTLRWIARIATVDPATGEHTTIPVGRSPHGIFVQPRREAMPVSPEAAAARSLPRPGAASAPPEDMAEAPAPGPTTAPAAPAAVQVARAERTPRPRRPAVDRPPGESEGWWHRWMAR